MIFNVTVRNNAVRRTINVGGEKTIREVFEEADVEVGNGQLNLDGVGLRESELDKTLDEFNLDKDAKHFLASISKIDNAVTAEVTGGAMIVKSKLTADEFETVLEYAPEAANLYDEKEEVVEYSLGMKPGKGSIGKFGAEFGTFTADGYPTITIPVPESVSNEGVREWVKNYSRQILKIDEVENQMQQMLSTAYANKTKIESAVTIH